MDDLNNIGTGDPHVLYLPPDTVKPLSLKDTRGKDAITGLPVTDKNNLSRNASSKLIQRIVKASKDNGVDPYTALAIAHQETGLEGNGDSEWNPFHLINNKEDDLVTAGVKMIKEKLDYAKKLNKNDEASQIQAFNGYGKVGANTEGKQKKLYGIDVTSKPINMNSNPVYGKRILDIRDNILKNNPEIQKMIGEPISQPVSNKHYLGTGPPDIGLNAGPGDPTNPTAPAPPANYAPLSVPQRQDWNAFLDYLGKKGVGGSKDLDARDKGLGLSYLKQYQKENPNTTITPDLIRNVQYDQYLLRKGDSFNGLNPEQMKYMRAGLNPSFLAREISPIDSWIGSITSKLYYPQARRGDNVGNSYNYGTDVESYIKGLTNPEINEKFREKK